MNKYLGDRIKEARKKAEITQKELAKRLQIAYPTLNKYEKGHRVPDAELLSRIATELQCDPAWLLTGEIDAVRQRLKIEGTTDEDIEEYLTWKKENPLTVAEERTIYNVKSDPELAEINEWLRENPVDKKLIYKLIKGRKITKEALEDFQGKNILKEEG